MSKPRLGVLFQVIYPESLAVGDLPNFRVRARAGALDWLGRKGPTYRVAIYPQPASEDLALGIQAWLFLEARRYGERHGLPDPTGFAMGMIDMIDCVPCRPADLDWVGGGGALRLVGGGSRMCAGGGGVAVISRRRILGWLTAAPVVAAAAPSVAQTPPIVAAAPQIERKILYGVLGFPVTIARGRFLTPAEARRGEDLP